MTQKQNHISHFTDAYTRKQYLVNVFILLHAASFLGKITGTQVKDDYHKERASPQRYKVFNLPPKPYVDILGYV